MVTGFVLGRPRALANTAEAAAADEDEPRGLPRPRDFPVEIVIFVEDVAWCGVGAARPLKIESKCSGF
jgi:hypothetical protein